MKQFFFRHKNVIVGIGFFLIGALAATQCAWNVVETEPFSFWQTKASNWPKGGDTGSYREGAYALLNGDWRNGTLTNWAPGYTILSALCIGLLGEEHHAPKLLVIHLILWSIALTFAWNKIKFSKSGWLRFAILAAITLPRTMRNSLYGEGIYHSESSTHALFVIALVFFADALINSKNKNLYWCTFFLGLTANFRTVLDYTLKATFLLIAFLTFVHWILSWAYDKNKITFSAYISQLKFASSATSGARWAFRTALICLLIFGATTFPWKFRNLVMYQNYTFTLAGSDYEWQFQWTKDDSLHSVLEFSNAACHADPVLCDVINRNPNQLAEQRKGLALMTLFRKPLQWIKYKYAHSEFLWFGVYNEVLEKPEGLPLRLEGYLYVLGFLVFIYFSTKRLFNYANQSVYSRALALIGCTYIFTGMNAGMMLFLHYEPRYALTWRIFWLFSGFIGYAFYRETKSETV